MGYQASSCSNFVSQAGYPFCTDTAEICVVCHFSAQEHEFNEVCYNKICQEPLNGSGFILGEMRFMWLALDTVPGNPSEPKKFCSVECLKRYLN